MEESKNNSACISGSKIRWRSGMGESLGFAACILLLVMLIVSIISITSYSTRTQQLTSACYAAGRAAAVSSDSTLAKARAVAVLKTIYGSNSVSSSSSTDKDAVWYKMEKPSKWKIGQLVTFTVFQHIETNFPIFTRDIQRSIVMMIEDETLEY